MMTMKLILSNEDEDYDDDDHRTYQIKLKSNQISFETTMIMVRFFGGKKIFNIDTKRERERAEDVSEGSTTSIRGSEMIIVMMMMMKMMKLSRMLMRKVRIHREIKTNPRKNNETLEINQNF